MAGGADCDHRVNTLLYGRIAANHVWEWSLVMKSCLERDWLAVLTSKLPTV